MKTRKLRRNFLAKSHFTFLLVALVLLQAIIPPHSARAAGFQFGGIRHDISTTATAAGTTTLTSASRQVQRFTGTTTQTVVLPDATTLKPGYWYTISNDSTGTVTVDMSGGTDLTTLTQDQSATIYLVAAGSAAGTWDVQKGGGTGGGGAGDPKEYWQGLHEGDCIFARNNGSYGIPDPDSTCTFTERFDPFTEWSVSSTVSGADKTAGITFTPPSTTYYKICAKIQQEGSSGTSGEFQLWDNDNSLELGVVGSTVQNVSREADACGLLDATGGGARTIYIRTKSSGGATNIGSGSSLRTDSAIEWRIEEL